MIYSCQTFVCDLLLAITLYEEGEKVLSRSNGKDTRYIIYKFIMNMKTELLIPFTVISVCFPIQRAEATSCSGRHPS